MAALTTARDQWVLAVLEAELPAARRAVALLAASTATPDGRAASLASIRAASRLRIPRWVLVREVEALREDGWLEREPLPRGSDDDHRLVLPNHLEQ